MFSKNCYVAFPEGKQKVFTLSYDDANVLDKRLVEMLRKYGVKGTFNINSGIVRDPKAPKDSIAWRCMELSEAVKVYGDDMEIAIHGRTHPWWDRMPTDLAFADIMEDRRALEKATGKIIRGGAYPYGTYNDDVIEMLRLCGIVYCRTTGREATGKLTALPKEPLRLQPTCHHKYEKLPELAEKFVTKTPKFGCWMLYVWGHTFEFERDGNWHVMEELLKTVSGKDDIWYATNLEMVDYLNASKKLQYDLDETMVHNPTATTVWLRCKLPGVEEEQVLKVMPGETVRLPE